MIYHSWASRSKLALCSFVERKNHARACMKSKGISNGLNAYFHMIAIQRSLKKKNAQWLHRLSDRMRSYQRGNEV